MNNQPLPLGTLLQQAGIPGDAVTGPHDVSISGISTHAQRTPRGGLFIAVRGTTVDSHLLLGEAVEAGAAALLVEQEVPAYPGIAIIRVSRTRPLIGPLAQAFFGHPARQLKMCAVTGTNGKTTVTTLIAHVLQEAGVNTGLIGTLGARFNGRSITTSNTTPDALQLASMLAAMHADGVEAVAMEASSHAIDQARIAGIPLSVAAFTNLTQDHLDYHGTFEAYGHTKQRLFTHFLAQNPDGIACYNGDDAVVAQLMGEWLGPATAWSEEDPAAIIGAENVRCSPHGISMVLRLGGERFPVSCNLVGSFNVSNMLAAASCCRAMGLPGADIARGLSTAVPVAGRFEYIDEGQPFTVIVDYAHTPDALERLLRNARRLCANRLVCVFGCGGDRDRTKRPQMGKTAGDHSDFLIITNDNPRREDPAAIAADIRLGVALSCLKPNRCHLVLDRFQAIDQAVNIACPGDVVVIAGKGHENYQDIGLKRIPFDDREAVRKALRELKMTYEAGGPAHLQREQTT